jgi:hypothetical protein
MPALGDDMSLFIYILNRRILTAMIGGIAKRLLMHVLEWLLSPPTAAQYDGGA